jgi:hypothetical protein
MDLTAAIAAAARHAFSVWMPLDSFAPVTFAAAATAAGPSAVRSVVCGALTPRDGVESNPEFYAVIAAILRRTLITEGFGVTGLHVVSLPHAKEITEALIESLMACLQSLDCGTHRESSLFELMADYFVAGDAAGDALLARTCDVVRRHRHTLRRLKVPRLLRYNAPTFADALAECTALTWLDLSYSRFPFRSWQPLGPTLHTLKLSDLIGNGTDTTFRLLADNMPALRELEFFTPGHPPLQDGFVELVSRLRSLTLKSGRPYAYVRDRGAWPLSLPNLQELLWCAGYGADAVAVAVLRRAVSLRAVHVSHASALAAIAAGPTAGADSSGHPSSYPPLSHVQTLTLIAVATDAASLTTIVAASPRASVVQLRWSGSAPVPSQVLNILLAAASASSGEKGGVGWRRVRRVRLDMDYYSAAPDIQEAARCVLALFPRARYASWRARGSSDVQLLPPPI